MSVVQCMGGWCQQRDRCAHYVADPRMGRAPIERMCDKGADAPEPIRTRFQQLAAIRPREQVESRN